MKIRFFSLWIVIGLACNIGLSRNIFVSVKTGSDKNDGTSLDQAFKSIQYAALVSQPGDTVLIAPGQYKSSTKHLFRISQSGSPDHWIVYKNLEIDRPVLYVSNEAAISIQLASYIQIEGMEITIDPDFISKNNNPEQVHHLTSKGNGIQIEKTKDEHYLSHHIRIKNNYIHDCPGMGIDVFSADYIEILFNTIQANGNLSMISNCGIRMQFLNAFDQIDCDHILIQYNTISDHRQQGPLAKINNSCEENYGGSGIALRNNRFAIYNPHIVAYVMPILISNNIIYLNGGQAIDIFETDKVSIINNTTYQNNQNNESRCGELNINKSKNDNIYNNIFFARIKMAGSSVSNYENVKFKNNLYANTTNFFKGEKDLNEDPLFTKTDHHLGEFDFELRPKSSAINTGINERVGATDFNGAKRIVGGSVDMGALEYTGTLPKPRDHDQMRIDKRHVTVSWQYAYSQATGQIIILNSKGDVFSARLFNNTGKLIAQEMNVNGLKRGLEFDVSGLPNGLYFVSAFSNHEKISTRYFVQNSFANLLK